MKRTLTLLSAALLLGACQTTPPRNAALDDARATLERARNDPYVMRSGAVEVDRAQQSLARAEAEWASERDDKLTAHQAYVAKQRAEIAIAIGAQAQAEEKLQQASTERERARLDARTREAEMAAAQARSAQAQASSAQAQAAQQSDRAAQLERDLKDLQAKPTDRGMVVTFGDVLFDTGRATLKPGSRRNIARLADVMRQYPERRLLVEGFTDSQGAEDMNLELSQRRADAFRQGLIDAGVAADRIEVRAHGEAFPVASNDSAAGRQQNRRVEVLFSDAQGKLPSAR